MKRALAVALVLLFTLCQSTAALANAAAEHRAPTPTLAVMAEPGTAPGTTRLTADVGRAFHLAVQIADAPIATPALGSKVPAGLIDPYQPGTDLGGVDAQRLKYVGVYEVNTGNSVLRFGQVVLTEEQIKLWSLVWSDEFAGAVLDRSKWTFDLGNGFYDANGAFVPGWGNSELQYYTDRPENVRVEDGRLLIEARQESYEGAPYTSARLKTKGLFSKAYGRFEVRAKLPAGKGYWPALWMLPEENRYGGWAASGEIDIMEAKGSLPGEVNGTLHYGELWPANKYSGKTYHFADGTGFEDFHVYTLEWEPGEFRWYVDGVLYQTQNDWHSRGQNTAADFTYPAPFDQPFHLLMNLAVGGHYDGNPDGSTLFPKRMEVDYVRVYELTGRPYRTPVKPVVAPEPLPPGAKQPTADGNLVWNSSFDQTVAGTGVAGVPGTAYWQFLHLPDFGGNAALSVEPVDGVNFARTDITQAGNQTYSVQLIQTVTVGKGRWYKLSFDAKAGAARSIAVKVNGGAERGYATYSNNETFALTTGMQRYTMLFQMAQETDVAARLEFNMGLSTSPVWIGRVRLEETQAPVLDENACKAPLGDGNHVYNGTFDQGDPDRMTFWQFSTAPGAQATAAVPEAARELQAAIAAGGSDEAAVTLVQNGIDLRDGRTYQLSFAGRAEVQRPIAVALRSPDGSAYATGTVTLTPAMTAHTLALPVSGATGWGQLAFLLGGSDADVVLDDVVMISTGGGIDPNIDLFPLENGRFDSGLAPWTSYIHFDASATVGVEEGQAQVAIAGEGNEPWSVILMQTGLSLSANTTYVLAFDVQSTVAREMEVTVENASYFRYLSHKVALTGQTTRHRFEFKMPQNDTADLKFLLGKMAGATGLAAHEVRIDNVVLEVKNARQLVSILQNGTFGGGLNPWGTFFADWDGANGAGTVVNGELNVAINYEGPQFWSVQAHQGDFQVEGGKRYLLTFDARSSVPRQIEAIVEHNGGDYAKYARETVALSEAMKTFEVAFTVPATDAHTHLVFAMGRVGDAVGTAHTVIFDNVSLIEIGTAASPPPPAAGVRNGTFDAGTDPWQFYTGDGSDGALSVDGGRAKVSFSNYDGWFTWSTQLYQTGISLEGGKSYTLSFEASATAAKTIRVALEKAADYNVKYLEPVTAAVTADTATFSYDFTMPAAEEANAKLVFMLGSDNAPGPNYAGQSLYLDNIVLTKQP